MDKIILFFIFMLLVFSQTAQASEIFGNISTDPNALVNGTGIVPSPGGESGGHGTAPAGIASPVYPVKPKTAASVAAGIPASPQTAEKVKVLGTAYFPDNTLLRGSDQKIYVIRKNIKRHLLDLKELNRYRGQAIIDVTDEELARYVTGHFDGELVRERGTVKVYVVKNGKKQHIRNLTELRAYYRGQTIYNINREEMALYN